MSRKRTKSKTGILFITSILMLSTLVTIGGSYGWWTDELYIDGKITTSTWTSDETAWARMNNDPADFTYEFPGSSWATYIKYIPDETIQIFYLYADQEYRVGELHVSNDSSYLYVEYYLDAGFDMSVSHLHISTSLSGIPQTGGGNPKIGHFEYSEEYDPRVENDLFQIDWDSDWDNEELCIAAHAVVWGTYF